MTRVPSTRPETVVPLSSSPFFRRSAAAFMRSSEPVSELTSEPALGFLNLSNETNKNAFSQFQCNQHIQRAHFQNYTKTNLIHGKKLKEKIYEQKIHNNNNNNNKYDLSNNKFEEIVLVLFIRCMQTQR